MADLLLDLGNSAPKWAVGSGGAVCSPTRRISYKACAEPCALAARLNRAWPESAPPGRILAASVAGEELEAGLEAELQRYCGVRILWLRSTPEALGVRNGYEEPAELGADRWAAILAAHARAPGGACIVDAGTAVTVDALAPGGEHLGGAIFPGRTILGQSLTERASRLPSMSRGSCPAIPARTTREAMAGGVHVGYQAAVRGMIDEVCSALPPEGARVLITGGDAAEVAAMLGDNAEQVPSLVLEGIAQWGASVRS